MNRLLSANLICLRKHKFFWIGMSFMFAAGIFFPVNRYLDMKQCGSVNNLDNGFFGCALFIGILTAVFCSLYAGTEYSDGTMRNKIVIGHYIIIPIQDPLIAGKPDPSLLPLRRIS